MKSAQRLLAAFGFALLSIPAHAAAPVPAVPPGVAINEDFPDPAVLHAPDGFYYAYATQGIVRAANPAAGTRMVQNLQLARSADLVHWERVGDALPVKPAWANRTQKFWAPDISLHDGIYYLYFAAEANAPAGAPGDQSGDMCLGVATARVPQGPFVDSGHALVCGPSFVNIDPMAFDDPATGKRLLYWGSGFAPIRVQELAPDRLSFAPGSHAVGVLAPRPSNPPTYLNLVEGAYVTERSGTYYLYFSGDSCCEPTHYSVMVAKSRSAFGPFTLLDPTGKSGIVESDDNWLAPGHCSVLREDDGREFIFYHAIDRKRPFLSDVIPGDRFVRRVLKVGRLSYTNGWPAVDHPGEN